MKIMLRSKHLCRKVLNRNSCPIRLWVWGSGFRCRANMAHARQSSPDSGHSFQGDVSSCPLHPTPSTLRPHPCTLYLTPSTLHPLPYTLYPTPSTLHPHHCTLHHQPGSFHPRLEAVGSRVSGDTTPCRMTRIWEYNPV